MPNNEPGDTAAGTERIEVRVRGIQQLFNSIDPSPFHDRDLDPDADDFIESWARQTPRTSRLTLQVNLDEPAGDRDQAILQQGIGTFYARKAEGARRRLRDLFRRGRISLVIAVGFLAILSFAANAISVSFQGPLTDIVREGLLIGGWVAMWRPLEIFLYDWWPIRAQARLFDRLATMPVTVRYPDLDGNASPART